jgi:hypothetical protein
MNGGTLDGASQEGLPILVLVHSRPSCILEFCGIQCFTHPYLNKQTAKVSIINNYTQWTKKKPMRYRGALDTESSTEPTVIIITGL